MPAKAEKLKGLHSFKAWFKVLTTKNEPAANIIDGNVQLYVLSHIPDIFKGVAEMVLNRLPNHQELTQLQIYIYRKLD